MTHHDLKIEAPHWWALKEGRKTFEARRDDRGFNVGDTITLHPYDRDVGAYLYEMADLHFRISHLQTYGMAPGYVGLSLVNLEGSR